MSDARTLRAAGTALLHRPGRGDGPPLILLHGIGSDARSWEGVLAALDPAITAYAWDAPGYGTSDLLATASPAPAEYAARLLAILDEMALGRVVVAGHSLGCLFAGAFAAMYPDRVAALALLSPALGYRVPAGAPLPSGAQARLDDLAALGPVAMAEKRAARLVFQPDGKPAVLAGMKRAMGALRPEGYAAAVRALAAGDLLADLAQVTIPSLVAIGAEDVVTPPANARAAAAVLVGLRSEREVPATGHALPLEEPAIVAALLRDLVEMAR